jgi:hypothetical protein
MTTAGGPFRQSVRSSPFTQRLIGLLPVSFRPSASAHPHDCRPTFLDVSNVFNFAPSLVIPASLSPPSAAFRMRLAASIPPARRENVLHTRRCRPIQARAPDKARHSHTRTHALTSAFMSSRMTFPGFQFSTHTQLAVGTNDIYSRALRPGGSSPVIPAHRPRLVRRVSRSTTPRALGSFRGVHIAANASVKAYNRSGRSFQAGPRLPEQPKVQARPGRMGCSHPIRLAAWRARDLARKKKVMTTGTPTTKSSSEPI